MEIRLNEFIGVVASNLNRVLISANSTVATKTPEFALNGAFPYFAIKMGFMNVPYLSLPFTIPAIIKVWLMSMDIRAVVVYLVMMVSCVLVMAPGIRRYDRKLQAMEAEEVSQ